MEVVSESVSCQEGREGRDPGDLLLYVLDASLNPRRQCDMVPIYSLTCPVCQESQLRRKGESCSKQRLVRECFGLLPLAQMRQLLSRSYLYEGNKSCTQVRIGPSLCLAEFGLKMTLWISQSLPRCQQWQ